MATITANLNGGDETTPDNELIFKIYGDADNYTTAIATTGNAINDSNVSVAGGVVTISNVDVTGQGNIKLTSIDAEGNESSQSVAFVVPINVFESTTELYSLTNRNLNETNIIGITREDTEVEQMFTSEQLIDGTAETFCNGTNGLVSFIAGQKAGFHATQNVVASMPLIIDNGVIRKDVNGNPTMLFDGVDDFLVNESLTLTQSFSISMMCKNALGGYISDFAGSGFNIIGISSGSQLAMNNGTGLFSSTGFINENQNVISLIADGVNSKIRYNLLDDVTGDSGGAGLNGIKIGVNRQGTVFFAGEMQEIALYDSVVESDIIEIEKVIGKFWLDIPDSVNVFLQGGQSNSNGIISTTEPNTPVYLQDNIVDGVRVFNSETVIPYNLTDSGQKGNGSNFSNSNIGVSNKFSFGDVTLKEINDARGATLICKVTLGGTKIANTSSISWNADYASIPAGGIKLLESLENRFNNLINLLNRYGVNFTVRGFIWHQGEGDNNATDAPNYESNWLAIIAKIRDFTGVQDLPIIHGTVSQLSADFNQTIETAQLTVASNDVNIHCRDNSALTLFDPVHFDADSAVIFGEWASQTILANYNV